MLTPSEHETVQARILAYAEAIGWTFVPCEEAEQRRGGAPVLVIECMNSFIFLCRIMESCGRV